MFRSFVLGVALCVSLATPAFAIPVQWSIHGLFPDGASTNGTFTVDVDTGQFWAIDITSTPGPAECRDGVAYYYCISPGAHFTDALYFTFVTRPDGQKGVFEMVFLSEGPSVDAFIWHARPEQRFDGECAFGLGVGRPDYCVYLPGNEGGSRELVSDSEEEQCGGGVHCSVPNNRRKLANGSPNYASNYMIGTVVPLPAAAWLFGGALGLLGVARRRSAA